jgi:hypothetical protein
MMFTDWNKWDVCEYCHGSGNVAESIIVRRDGQQYGFAEYTGKYQECPYCNGAGKKIRLEAVYVCAINPCGGLRCYHPEFHDIRDPLRLPAIAFNCQESGCKGKNCVFEEEK